MVDQDVMKGPNSLEDTRRTSVDRESKFARVKRMLTCQTRTPLTYDEAKASAKARKRKERQESISSISQERKVIRSNSEERPICQKNENNKDIRRVSSNEDFQHSQPLQTHNDNVATLAIQDGPMKISPQRDITIDDCEFERRRSHERFSRPLVQRGRYNQPRKPKTKQFSKNYNGKEKSSSGKKVKHERAGDDVDAPSDVASVDGCNFLQLKQNNKEKERSPSPVHTPASPALDLTTLHQQIDNAEPVLSNINDEAAENQPSLSVASNRLLSSPRNSVIITQRIYLNPDVPLHPSLKDPINPLEQRQRHIAKQINSLKKKLKKVDDDFETKNGYRPSHADKLNDKSIKKLCAELNKLKKEQRALLEDATSPTTASGIVKQDAKKTTSTLKDTLQEIEKRLDVKRGSVNRSNNVEELSNDQLLEEKTAVQKALLYLESVHGRPSNKEDKDAARPLYDRYRLLKRSLARMNAVSNVIELATIHEHETMDFISLPTQVVETESDKMAALTGSTTDSDTDTSIGENLHALSLEELRDQQKSTNEEKKQLRRSLKEFEADFETKTGRKLQKEDRASMETVYTSYKRAKAKLKLLDALVGKQAL